MNDINKHANNPHKQTELSQTPEAPNATFSIYQLKGGDEMRDYRWEPLDRLNARSCTVERGNYDLVYTAPLTAADTLDSIFKQFNIDRPDDFLGHSLSVSDVIVLQQHGHETAHYVDRFGFVELPHFMEQDKQLSQRRSLTSDKASILTQLQVKKAAGQMQKRQNSAPKHDNCTEK